MSNPKSKAQRRKNEPTRAESRRESEEQFRHIVESVPMGMHMYRLEDDDRLVLIGANPAAEKILGVDHSQFIGQTIEEAFPALVETELPDRYRRVAATGEAWQTDQVIYEKNQIVSAFEVNAFQILPGEMVASFLDIAERKRTEADLRRLSRAVEQSANTVVITDTEGYIEYVNPKFIKTSGYSREEAIGQHTRVMKSGATPSEEYKGLWETITAGKEWQGEFHNKRKNGELFWELASISPIKDEQGHITHFLAVKEDITARKQAEAELESRLKELQVLQRLMTREGWQEFQGSQEQAAPGYLFDQAAVRPVERDELDLAANGQAQGDAATEKTPGHKAVTKPLAVSGESIGTLGIYDDDPDNPLSPEDQAFLDEVAAQVAEALERARLLEQSRSALAETETLYQAGRRITEAENLQEVVAAVMEVSAIPAIRRAVLLSLEQDSAGDVEAMRVVANWHNGEGTEPTPIGTIYSKAMLANLNMLLSSEPLFFGDVQHDDRTNPTIIPMLQQRNIQAVAVVPLWIGTRHVGSLVLEAEEIYEFSDQDTRLILALADQAAVAIDNQRLLDETQAALAEVEATQRRYTVQAWEAYRGKRQATSYEEDREGVPPLGEQLPPEVSRAVAEKKPVASYGSVKPALPASEDDEAPADEAKSSLTVPLTVRDEVIGVLGLQNTAEARNWTPEEIALVEAITEQVAQAAEQLRLFDETQQRAAREQRVGEIGDKIRAAHTLDEALQVAITEVGLSLKAPQTTVKLEVE